MSQDEAMEGARRPAPFDYDEEALRAGIGRVSGLDRDPGFDGCILREEFRDVHPRIADGLALAQSFPVLDMGCGTGTLGRLLTERGVSWVGIDRSFRQLAAGFGPRLRGEATRLPFRDARFGSVAALYMLYHLDEPVVALQEAGRVMLPGGTFVTCAPSRDNHPELLALLPAQPLDTFDAEAGPEMVASVFDAVRTEPWDMLLYRLTSGESVWNYLVARQTDPAEARLAAERATLPLWVRAKGAVIWARKPG
jgi:SAM-dependent methyltransferase